MLSLFISYYQKNERNQGYCKTQIVFIKHSENLYSVEVINSEVLFFYLIFSVWSSFLLYFSEVSI